MHKFLLDIVYKIYSSYGLRPFIFIGSICYLTYAINYFIFNSHEVAMYLTNGVGFLLAFAWKHKVDEVKRNRNIWETRFDDIDILLNKINTSLSHKKGYLEAQFLLGAVIIMLSNYTKITKCKKSKNKLTFLSNELMSISINIESSTRYELAKFQMLIKTEFKNLQQ